jgi:hypothetical protein
MLYWQLGCAQRAKIGANAPTVGEQTSAIHSHEYVRLLSQSGVPDPLGGLRIYLLAPDL